MQIKSLKIRPLVSIVLLIMMTFFFQPSSIDGASLVRTNKGIYNQGEVIQVYFSNAPGNDRDWICIVPVGSPDTDGGDYKYMPRGSSQGYITFDPLPPGQYEVRAYYNYRQNGYVVSGRYAFSVASDSVTDEPLAQYVEPIEPNNSLEAEFPPPIPFVAPPNMIVLPGTDVYVVPDVEVDIFFQGGWWWRQWRGNWYRSSYYDHGWAHYRDYPSWHRKIPSDWRHNYGNRIWGSRPWNPPQINHGNLNNHWRGGYWRSNPGLGHPILSRPPGGPTRYGGNKPGGDPGRRALPGVPGVGHSGRNLQSGPGVDPGRRALPGGTGGGTSAPILQRGGKPGGPGGSTLYGGPGGGRGKSNLRDGGKPGGGPDRRNLQGGVKSERTYPDGRMNRSHDGGSNRGDRR